MPTRPTLWRVAVDVSNRFIRACLQKVFDRFLRGVRGRAVQRRFTSRAHITPERQSPRAGDRTSVRVSSVLDEKLNHGLTISSGYVLARPG